MASYAMQSDQATRKVYDGQSFTTSKAQSGVKSQARLRKKSPPLSSSCDEDDTRTGAVRRSGRVRNLSFHDPTYVHFDDTLPLDQGLIHSDTDTEENDDWATVSAKHQAAIPAWRPRPAQPTPSEAKFLQAVRVYPAADSTDSHVAVASSAVREFHAIYMATVPKARAALLASTVTALDQQLGSHLVKVLGLDLLGSKHAATWQPHEELLFCLGMCDKYRMFKSMRRLFLKSRSVHELNGYYHNVWKTRSTPEADEFLTLREAAAGEQEFWVFEEGIRQRLAAMWDPSFGELPVSAAGPAPIRPRLVKVAYAPLPAKPPGRIGRPPKARPSPNPTGQVAGQTAGVKAAAGSSPAAAAAANGGSSRVSSGGGPVRAVAGQVDLTDPAALAAMPAQLPVAAITPRPGAFVLSNTPGGRMKLEPGLTHLGAAAAAAAAQSPGRHKQQLLGQQQQQTRLPVLQLPPQMQTANQQQQLPLQPRQPCTLLLVPLQQQGQSPGQQQRQQLVRLMPLKAEQAGAGTPPQVSPQAAVQLTAPLPAVQPASAPVLVVAADGHAAAAAAQPQQQVVEQQVQQQQVAAVSDEVGMLPPALCFPEMPRMPDMPLPDGDDPEALAAWMQALSACRAAMAQFKQQVAKTADTITQDAQSHISQVQQQQRQVMGKVDSYLLDLSKKEVQIISSCNEQLELAPAAQQPGCAHDSLQPPLQGQEQGEQQRMQPGHSGAGQLQDEQGHALLSTEEPLSPTYTSGQLDDLQSAVQQLLQRPGSKTSHMSGCADDKRQRAPGSCSNATESSHQQQQEEDARRAAKKRKLVAAAAACSHMVAAAAAAAVIVID